MIFAIHSYDTKSTKGGQIDGMKMTMSVLDGCGGSFQAADEK